MSLSRSHEKICEDKCDRESTETTTSMYKVAVNISGCWGRSPPGHWWLPGLTGEDLIPGFLLHLMRVAQIVYTSSHWLTLTHSTPSYQDQRWLPIRFDEVALRARKTKKFLAFWLIQYHAAHFSGAISRFTSATHQPITTSRDSRACLVTSGTFHFEL